MNLTCFPKIIKPLVIGREGGQIATNLRHISWAAHFHVSTAMLKLYVKILYLVLFYIDTRFPGNIFDFL